MTTPRRTWHLATVEDDPDNGPPSNGWAFTAVANLDNGELLAASDYGGLWKSIDGGKTWAWFARMPLNCVSRPGTKLWSPEPGVAFMWGEAWNGFETTGGGLLRSTDAGATWEVVFPASNVGGVAGLNVDQGFCGFVKLSDTSYVAVGGTAGPLNEFGQRQMLQAFRSNDRGLSWVGSFIAPNGDFPDDPTLSSNNTFVDLVKLDDDSLLATFSYISGSSPLPPRVWRSIDGGVTWAATGPFPDLPGGWMSTPGGIFALCNMGAGVVLATGGPSGLTDTFGQSNFWIWRSRDAGLTWTRIVNILNDWSGSSALSNLAAGTAIIKMATSQAAIGAGYLAAPGMSPAWRMTADNGDTFMAQMSTIDEPPADWSGDPGLWNGTAQFALTDVGALIAAVGGHPACNGPGSLWYTEGGSP